MSSDALQSRHASRISPLTSDLHFECMVVGFSLTSVDKKQYSEVHLPPNLTNRFHFAVRLYSDNAQMTSKRGGNKGVRYEPQASSVTDVLTDVLCALSENRPTAKWNLFVLYN